MPASALDAPSERAVPPRPIAPVPLASSARSIAAHFPPRPAQVRCALAGLLHAWPRKRSVASLFSLAAPRIGFWRACALNCWSVLVPRLNIKFLELARDFLGETM